MAAVPNIDPSFLISFVVVTVLYGTIISPQLAKLADLRDRITSVNFPKQKWWEDTNERQLKAEMESVREKLEGYFYAYEIKYLFLRRFIDYFWASIGVTLIYQIGWAFWKTFAEHQSNNADYWFILSILGILFLLEHALHSYLINDDKLRSLDWLTLKGGLNPFSVLGALDTTLSMGNKKPFGEPITAEDPLYFMYAGEMHITGMRFFLQVRDKEDINRVYLAGMGPIGEKTFVARSMDHGGSYTYFIDLGGLPLNLIHDKELRADLFLFASPFNNNWDNPYLITMFQDTPSGDYTRLMAGRSGESFRVNRGDGLVTFKGQGYSIQEVVFKPDALLNEQLFRIYEKRFKKSKKVLSAYDVGGDLIEASSKSKWSRFLTWLDAQFTLPNT